MPEPKPKGKGLKGKLGPLPVWGWAALIVGGVAVWYLFLRKPSSAGAGLAPVEAGATGTTAGGTSAGGVDPALVGGQPTTNQVDQSGSLAAALDLAANAQTQLANLVASDSAGALALAQSSQQSLSDLAGAIATAGFTPPSTSAGTDAGGTAAPGAPTASKPGSHRTAPARTHRKPRGTPHFVPATRGEIGHWAYPNGSWATAPSKGGFVYGGKPNAAHTTRPKHTARPVAKHKPPARHAVHHAPKPRPRRRVRH